MKYLPFILFLLSSISAFSQSKGIKCIYVSKIEINEGIYQISNKVAVEQLVKMYNEDRRVYTLSVENGYYEFKRMPESVIKVGLEIDALDYYANFNNGTFANQYAYYGEQKYIIKGKTKDYRWDITGKTQEIDGRTCMEAKLEGEDGVTAWFTTDIPFGYAPLGYYGLPGLAVKLSVPYYDLYLKEIHEESGMTFTEPTKGKVVTQEEVNKKYNIEQKALEERADKIIK